MDLRIGLERIEHVPNALSSVTIIAIANASAPYRRLRDQCRADDVRHGRDPQGVCSYM